MTRTWYEDPDNAPPADLDDAQLAALIVEAREITAAQARAAEAAARLGHDRGAGRGRQPPRPGGAALGRPARRSHSPGSTPARPPGSRRVSRLMSRRAARAGVVPDDTAGEVTGTPGPPTTNCWA